MDEAIHRELFVYIGRAFDPGKSSSVARRVGFGLDNLT